MGLRRELLVSQVGERPDMKVECDMRSLISMSFCGTR
jgi:hypothetical protein